MKKSTKYAIITAAICIGAGIIISFISLAIIDFDFLRLNTVDFETRTYENLESFKNIDIKNIECDIRILPSQNGERKVICSESETIIHDVKVENDTLKITGTNNRRWFELIGIWTGDLSVIVYMPEGEYNSVYLKSVSGNINVSKNFRFTDAELITTSGDILFESQTSSGIYAKSVSGNIRLSNSSTGSVQASTTSGDIAFANITAKELKMSSTSGNTSFDKVAVSGEAECRTVSGDIWLENSDAASFKLKTVSGNIRGSILSPKSFDVKTVSGNVEIPPSDFGAGSFAASTTSGDIYISISKLT